MIFFGVIVGALFVLFAGMCALTTLDAFFQSGLGLGIKIAMIVVFAVLPAVAGGELALRRRRRYP